MASTLTASNSMADDTSPRRLVSARRLLPLGLLVAAWIVFMLAGGYRYLTFSALAQNRDWLCGLVQQWGILAAFVYIMVYAALVALSVPGAAVLTIAGGFLFGPGSAGCARSSARLSARPPFSSLPAAGLGGLAQRAGRFVAKLEAGFRADAFNYLLVSETGTDLSVLARQPRSGLSRRQSCGPMCSLLLSASFPARSSLPVSVTGSAT